MKEKGGGQPSSGLGHPALGPRPAETPSLHLRGRPFLRAPLPQDEHPAPSCSSLLPKEGTSLPSTNILPALCLHWSLGPASLLGLPALGHLSHSWPSFTSVDKALVSILENFCRTLLSPLRTSRILSSSMITFLLSDAPT